MNQSMRLIMSLILLLSLQLTLVHSRGKTYDDLDEILKHEGLNSTKTHVAHTDPMDQGAHIDPSKVVHKPPPQIQEDRAMTSGVVIPRAYTASNPTARKSSNQTKTYEQYAKKSDNQPDSLPLRYLKIPKRDRDAQFYFFLSTLLLLATTITIISSCGCLFYFLLKNLVSMQERIVDDSNNHPYDNNQREQAERRQGSNQPRNNNNFMRFEDEEQIQRDEIQQKQEQDKLPNLLGGQGRSGPHTQDILNNEKIL